MSVTVIVEELQPVAVELIEQPVAVQLVERPVDVTLTQPAPVDVEIIAGGPPGPAGPAGPLGPPGPPGPSPSFTFTQGIAASVWTITHGMGKHPSVTVLDTAGDDIEPAVSYPDLNTVVLLFSAATSGNAYLN